MFRCSLFCSKVSKKHYAQPKSEIQNSSLVILNQKYSMFQDYCYPSEMHLWEGLLLMENKSGIFFSSDLVFRLGEFNGSVIEGNWQEE